MSPLPEGTLTFVYTDIEGSTPLWDQMPRAMGEALELHNRLLRSTLEKNHGHVYKEIGDAFQATFISPMDAVDAAVAIQRTLAETDWGEIGEMRVRVGIHVGTVQSSGNDYISSHTQNRVARIMSAGHGGQILLSLAVAELVRGNLPEGISLKDLGEHYLKGISQPERLFQVMGPGLQETFPPLVTRIVPRGYKLLEQIGSGSFGAVYRAIQPDIGREVAVKIILPQFANDPEFIRRFELEAQTVARLEHPHIVPLYDYWREPDGAYLVMRYMRGGGLETLLEQGPLDPYKTAEIVDQVASALYTAHEQGVIHRDLKPANILMDEMGNAYLSDFGIAKHLSEKGQHTLMSGMLGSPTYMSPEQLLRDSLSPQSDIYSFGLTLYHLLTGEPPFPDDSFAALIDKQLHTPLPSLVSQHPEIPEQVDLVIQRATDKDASRRFKDVLELAKAYRDSLAGEYRPAPELGVTPREEVQLKNPYKGLRAFQEADASEFYGREALVEGLLQALDTDAHKSSRNGSAACQGRFMAVVGPSGSGKSSLVKAGLIPALRRGSVDGSQDWFITEILPGTHPFEELELALQRIAVAPTNGLMEHLRRDERGLSRAARMVLPEDEGELLLVIDQFEEIFTLVESKDETKLFLDSLYAAVTDTRSRVRVVLTLRGDFYDRPLMFPQFGELIREYTQVVLPLTVEELEQAIRSPAEGVGLNLEEGLVTTIVTDVVDQPGALPLLQYALTELYEHRQGRTLTLQAYHDIGGVLGALGRRAEIEYDHFQAAEQEVTRQVFLRLVTLGEGTEDTRRRTLRSELAALRSSNDGSETSTAEDVIEAFGGARLLSFDRDPQTRSPTVEVAHEALLREWRRLRGWLDEDRADVRMQRLLGNLASEWRDADRDNSFLLRGSRLDQFESWAENTGLSLTGDETAFLQASATARAAQMAEEAARLEREAALERRSRLFRRAFVGLMAFATIISLVLTLFAFRQRDSALQNEALATSRELVRFAEAELGDPSDTSFSLALLLAREAVLTTWKVDSTVLPEAERVLREAINAAPILILDLSGHEASVNFSAWSPDGEQILTAGTDTTVRVWDSASGQQVLQLDGHTAEVNSAAWSSDGSRILTGSRDKTIRIWDADTGKQLNQFETHEAVRTAFWSPDNARILVAAGNYLQVIDVKSGESILEIQNPTGDFYFAAWDQSGQRFATAGQDRTILIGDPSSGETFSTLEAHAGAVNSVQWSHDGRYLLSSHADNLAYVWEIRSNSILMDLPHSAPVQFAAWSSDDTRIATVTATGDITLWDGRSGDVLRQWQSQEGIIWSISWGPGDTKLLTAENNGRARVWEARSLDQLQRLEHSTPVMSVDWNPDGSRLITAGGLSLSATIWGLENKTIEQTLSGHAGAVQSAAWSPDGSRVATASLDGTTMIWDALTWEKLKTLSGHTGGVEFVAWDPSGERLLTVGVDRTARIWEAASGESLQVLRAVTAGWSPDGERIVTADSENSLHIWDADSVEELISFPAHDDRIYKAIFSPDGSSILTTSSDQSAGVWDSRTGDLIARLEGHRVAVLSGAWSPDGSQVVTGDTEGKVLLWDPASGEQLGEITNHLGAVWSLAWSPNGSLLASSSQDRSVRISPVGVQGLLDQVEILIRRYPADFTDQERCLYLHISCE